LSDSPWPRRAATTESWIAASEDPARCAAMAQHVDDDLARPFACDRDFGYQRTLVWCYIGYLLLGIPVGVDRRPGPMPDPDVAGSQGRAVL